MSVPSVAFRLQATDVVALVCTGSTCADENEPRLTAEYLTKQYGLQTRYHFDTYQVITAEKRAEILYRYLADDAVKLIWSVRGGEGSADLIPYLHARAASIRTFNKKLLIGFSDFTPLLIYFQQQLAWPTVHGVGARQLYRHSVNVMTEQRTLHWLQQATNLTLGALKPLNPAAYVSSTIRAQVIGGNLTLVQLGLKDIWELDASGKILLLEEVNEKPYQVIRMLKHLLRIGFFATVKAVILAGFDFPALTVAENQDLQYAMQEVLQQFALQCHCPVLYTDLVGHGSTNLPVPFYGTANLQLGAQAQLIYC